MGTWIRSAGLAAQNDRVALQGSQKHAQTLQSALLESESTRAKLDNQIQELKQDMKALQQSLEQERTIGGYANGDTKVKGEERFVGLGFWPKHRDDSEGNGVSTKSMVEDHSLGLVVPERQGRRASPHGAVGAGREETPTGIRGKGSLRRRRRRSTRRQGSIGPLVTVDTADNDDLEITVHET
ncbi:MAG: hypothetical protein MMC23_006300 [Stictis urceolatum]|nr:hypothetical protein [Stictis urceolata]